MDNRRVDSHGRFNGQQRGEIAPASDANIAFVFTAREVKQTATQATDGTMTPGPGTSVRQ